MEKERIKELYDEIYFLESEYRQNEDKSDYYCSKGITSRINEGGNREKGYNLEHNNRNLDNKIEKLKKDFFSKTGENYDDVYY